MITCPNCGADMHFSPKSQLLSCKFCDSTLDPVEYDKSKGLSSEDHEEYDTTVFSCPQCGGEIMSTDDTAATFCSYCGSSVMLTSRMSMEKRPSKIIPFAIDFDECKTLYKDTIKKCLFAPSYMRKDSELEKFRGIYMPYWSYNAMVQQPLSFKGEKSQRNGDYIITDEYDINMNVDANFDGITYDSASSFDDNYSNNIGSFDYKKAKDFTPSYLSGFYADRGDVDSSVYAQSVKEEVRTKITEDIKKIDDIKDLSYDATKASKSINVSSKKPESMLCPVWFMGKRVGNRVSYAVINGQTGQISADIPIDIKKFMLGALLFALPVFLLFNFLFTLTPKGLCYSIIAFNIIGLLASCMQFYSISDRETRYNDIGYRSVFVQKTTPGKRYLTMSPKYYLLYLISILLLIAVRIANPVNDYVYYCFCILGVLLSLITLIQTILRQNLLASNALPQLQARGGDENAEI